MSKQSDNLEEMLERARFYEMTPEEREAQRRSFVYGNVVLHNQDVTREMVDEIADKMPPKQDDV